MSVEHTARTATAEQRYRIYRALTRHNRWIAVLRVAVPAAGVLVLGVLMVQIAFFSGSGEFSIGRVTVDRDTVTVETPSYSGVTADGSTYTVQAATARARLSAVDTIDITDGTMLLVKPDGTEFRAAAAEAVLQSNKEQVSVPGIAEVSNSSGTKGTLVGSFLDSPAQTLNVTGPVDIAFADGMTLKSEGMHYDFSAAIWTFSRARITIPSNSSLSGSAANDP